MFKLADEMQVVRSSALPLCRLSLDCFGQLKSSGLFVSASRAVLAYEACIAKFLYLFFGDYELAACLLRCYVSTLHITKASEQ